MPPFNPVIHHRKSNRLQGYDYSSAGLYFITLCTHNRKCLFGKITDGIMYKNDAGEMIENEWTELPKRFPNIVLHEYGVMPNHFHGILQIKRIPIVGAALVAAQSYPVDNIVGATLVVAQQDNDEQNNKWATTRVAPTNNATGNNEAATRAAQTNDGANKTVGDMMDAFKSITTVEYIRGVKTLGWPRFNGKIWQRNFHDHIIRNEQSYLKISEYILNNPARWKEDKFYVE